VAAQERLSADALVLDRAELVTGREPRHVPIVVATLFAAEVRRRDPRRTTDRTGMSRRPVDTRRGVNVVWLGVWARRQQHERDVFGGLGRCGLGLGCVRYIVGRRCCLVGFSHGGSPYAVKGARNLAGCGEVVAARAATLGSEHGAEGGEVGRHRAVVATKREGRLPVR